MKPRSKRDQQLALQGAHSHYAAMTGRPAMVEYDIPAKRVQRERGSNPDAAPLEHAEQVAVIKWWFHYAPTKHLHRLQLIAIPNAQIMFKYATNPHAVLSYLHAEGMRDGAPDLVLFHAAKRQFPLRSWNGLCIEMKRVSGGRTSDDQDVMSMVMHGADYDYQVCKGADAAISVIKNYVEGG